MHQWRLASVSTVSRTKPPQVTYALMSASRRQVAAPSRAEAKPAHMRQRTRRVLDKVARCSASLVASCAARASHVWGPLCRLHSWGAPWPHRCGHLRRSLLPVVVPNSARDTVTGAAYEMACAWLPRPCSAKREVPMAVLPIRHPQHEDARDAVPAPCLPSCSPSLGARSCLSRGFLCGMDVLCGLFDAVSCVESCSTP